MLESCLVIQAEAVQAACVLIAASELEVEHPQQERLLGEEADPPDTVLAWQVVAGVGGGHEEGGVGQGDLAPVLGAVVPDVGGVYTGVTDGDQAPAPHLALHHVQQEAELALLPTGVTAAPPEWKSLNSKVIFYKKEIEIRPHGRYWHLWSPNIKFTLCPDCAVHYKETW